MPAADRDRAVLWRLAADRHDLVGRVVRRAAGHVQLRVVDAEHVGEAVGAAIHPDRRRETGRGRVDERDAVAGRDRHPGQVDDLDAGQAPVRDGGFDGFSCLVATRTAKDDRGARRRICQARGVVGRVAPDQLGQRGGHGRWLVDGLGRSDQRWPGARRRRGPRCPAARRCPAPPPLPRPPSSAACRTRRRSCCRRRSPAGA